MVGATTLLRRKSRDVGRFLRGVRSMGDGERISAAFGHDRSRRGRASRLRLSQPQQRWLLLRHAMVHAHQRPHSTANLFGDSKFWRTKFLDAYKKHIAFSKLDSFVGNPSQNFQRILKHPMIDAYYDTMTPTKEQFQKMTVPILTITGQYDGDELGAMTYYRDHMANASAESRGKHFLVIGPWDHAGTRTPTDESAGVKFVPGAIVDLNDLHRQWYDWTMKNGPKPQFLKNQVAYYLLASGNSGAN